MEKALEIWKDTPDAPQLNLRTPWYGYELGHWTKENAEVARLMAQGDFIEVGEQLLEYQKPLTDEAAERMTHDLSPRRG